VFISKYGKTYDDADGSEQGFNGPGAPRPGAQRGGQIGRERWEDDGGPADDAPPPPAESKPPWSVLSARDLDAAIRRERLCDDLARARVEAGRAERKSAESRKLAEDRAADAARAWADRYRNAWENT
jgi:hypothetical protein